MDYGLASYSSINQLSNLLKRIKGEHFLWIAVKSE